jgi:hypothetical protein
MTQIFRGKMEKGVVYINKLQKEELLPMFKE